MELRRGLLHINLNVTSLETSVRFYCGALGFEDVVESEDSVDFGSGAEPVRQVVLTLPETATTLALTQAPSLDVGPKGLNHLGLILDSDSDLPALLDKVETHGGMIKKSGTREEEDIVEAFAYICDPDGYAIELSTQAILYSQMRRRG